MTKISTIPPASFFVPYCLEGKEALMIVQRNPKHGFHLIGGKQEVGETADQCLTRELQEELGVPSLILSDTDLKLFRKKDIFFDVLGCEAEASLYMFQVAPGDMIELLYALNQNAEFELTILQAHDSLIDREDVSKVAKFASDLLVDITTCQINNTQMENENVS